MRIPGNKLQHLSDFFYSELSGVYDRAEIASMLAEAAHHYLGFSRSDLVTRADENLNQSDVLKLYDCAKALKKGTPLQYILGSVPFYGTTILVNSAVLIPRPETEELCDIIVKEDPEACQILDLCTGSGCIAIALKKNLPKASVTATDISADALKTAENNAILNQLTVYFFQCDLLVTAELPVTSRFDVMVSNPPYVMESEKAGMAPHVLDNEPHLALFVKGEDPILFYKKIIDLCTRHLSPAGRLYFELNPLTAMAVLRYAESSGQFCETRLITDMSGKQRFFKAIKNSS